MKKDTEIFGGIGLVLLCLYFLSMSFLILSGCGKENGQHDLIYATSETGEGLRVTEVLLEEFMKKTNTKIKVQNTPGNAFEGKLLTQFASGTAPDVFQLAFFGGEIPYFVEKGVLLCLDDSIKADKEFKPDDYFKSSIDACSHKGKIYGLPKDGNPYILFYNKDLFDEARVKYPDETWTWDDFMDASVKLTRDKDGDGRIDVYGGGYTLGANQISSALIQSGGSIFNEDGSKCLLETSESISALRYIYEFRRRNLILTEREFRAIGGDDYAFKAGKLAMEVHCPYRIATYNKEIKHFMYDIAPLPFVKGNKRATQLILVGFCISNQTKNKKLSWELVKHLSGISGQRIMAENKYGVPCIKSVAESDLYSSPPEHIKVAVKAMEYAEFVHTFIGFSKGLGAINEQFELMDIGKKDFETAIKDAVKNAEKVIKEEKESFNNGRF